MTDTTARIKAKGLDSTGVTEQVARSYFDRLGSHHLAIVEYSVDSRSVDADGHQQVQLVLTAVEPVVDGDLDGQLDDHVRTIQKALYRNRKLAEGDDTPLPLDSDGPEPRVKDVLAQGIALLDTDQTGETVLWDGNTDAGAADRAVEMEGAET